MFCTVEHQRKYLYPLLEDKYAPIEVFTSLVKGHHDEELRSYDFKQTT